MAETLARTEPMGTQAIDRPGLSITLAPPVSRFSLRSRDPELLARCLDGPVPSVIGETAGGVARLGPDELLVIGPRCAGFDQATGQPISIVDVSERSVGIIVKGPKAVAVLSAGCPLDLERLAAGRAVRTIFETVEIIIIREQDDLFRVEVWRSFAPWLWMSFATLAEEV